MGVFFLFLSFSFKYLFLCLSLFVFRIDVSLLLLLLGPLEIIGLWREESNDRGKKASLTVGLRFKPKHNAVRAHKR